MIRECRAAWEGCLPRTRLAVWSVACIPGLTLIIFKIFGNNLTFHFTFLRHSTFNVFNGGYSMCKFINLYNKHNLYNVLIFSRDEKP